MKSTRWRKSYTVRFARMFRWMYAGPRLARNGAQWCAKNSSKAIPNGRVRQYFADYYGDRALSAPPLRGLNWLVYVLPPVFFLGGVFVLYRSLRKMHRPEKPVIEQPLPKDDPYLAKFEEQLKSLEEDENR
jgi:hypothetical protein